MHIQAHVVNLTINKDRSEVGKIGIGISEYKIYCVTESDSIHAGSIIFWKRKPPTAAVNVGTCIYLHPSHTHTHTKAPIHINTQNMVVMNK